MGVSGETTFVPLSTASSAILLVRMPRVRSSHPAHTVADVAASDPRHICHRQTRSRQHCCTPPAASHSHHSYRHTVYTNDGLTD